MPGGIKNGESSCGAGILPVNPWTDGPWYGTFRPHDSAREAETIVLERSRSRSRDTLREMLIMATLGFFFINPMYFVFVGPPMLLAMWAQHKVKSAYKRAGQVPASSGLSGALPRQRPINRSTEQAAPEGDSAM